MKKTREPKKNERFFIDLDVRGNANGGIFVKCPELKNKINEIEEDKTKLVVGVVYDDTDNLELVIAKQKK